MSTKIQRLFIAVELPDAIKHEIIRVQRYFKKKELFDGKYPAPEAMHLTLKFIGEVAESQMLVIRTLLRSIHAKKGQAQLNDINFFGSPAYMKVIFAQITCIEIAGLVAQIDQRLADYVRPEKTPFVGHITIARVKQVYDAQALVEAIKLCPLEQLAFPVDSFELKESALASEGPIHQTIECYLLS